MLWIHSLIFFPKMKNPEWIEVEEHEDFRQESIRIPDHEKSMTTFEKNANFGFFYFLFFNFLNS